MSTDELTALREALVEQVCANVDTISAAVRGALGAVPRHLFVPEVSPVLAYQDVAIVTKRDAVGQPVSSCSQPTMMVQMVGQLGLAPGQRVLEIGAGTGYNAALLCHVVGPAGEVVSIDIDPDVVQRARHNLELAGYPVTVICGDGADGYPAGAPYDRIIATVGVWDLAPSWRNQLASDGRLVLPLDLRGVQRSVALEQEGGHWVSRSAVPCGFIRLRGGSAGPERTDVLDRGSSLSIMVPDGGDLDRDSLLSALAGRRTTVPTRIAGDHARIFADLGLWLAVNEPRWCVMSESGSADPARLSQALFRTGDVNLTLGIHSRESVAMLADQAYDTTQHGLVAVGFGPDGESLAIELAAHMRKWDTMGRPGDGLHIEVLPKSEQTDGLDDRLMIVKEHTVLALSWPAMAE